MDGKSILIGGVVIVTGALLGSFIGGFIGYAFPEGVIHDLFSREITAGLSPALLDLRVLELTFGCLFKLNVPAILGILLSAFLYRTLIK